MYSYSEYYASSLRHIHWSYICRVPHCSGTYTGYHGRVPHFGGHTLATTGRVHTVVVHVLTGRVPHCGGPHTSHHRSCTTLWCGTRISRLATTGRVPHCGGPYTCYHRSCFTLWSYIHWLPPVVFHTVVVYTLATQLQQIEGDPSSQ